MTIPSDNYKADLKILAGYVNLDLLLFNWMRFNGGVRYKYGIQNVHTFDLSENNIPVNVPVVRGNWLPALNFTFPFLNKTHLRLGLSRTLNRPDFFEKSYVRRNRYLGEGEDIGNPEVSNAELYNGDSRFESYLSELEFFSLGGFYKYFTNPIVEVALPKSGTTVFTWDNAEDGYLIGSEFEWKLSFSLISDLIRSMIKSGR